MQLQNFTNNKNIDISLFFNVLNDNIYKDNRFIELMSLVKNDPYKYTYACYTESSYLKDNIYIPVFHTLYLGNKFHHVVLENANDDWLIDTFPNNQYYILSDDNPSVTGATTIHSLTQIGDI